MANNEHLYLIKQGIDSWNDWRKANPDVVPDLRGADLGDANLSLANLFGADLSNANLLRANLFGANLFSANLSGANLFSAELRGANLRSVNLSGADLKVANLFSAELRRAILSGADLSGAILSGADLSGDDLSKTNLERIQALGTNFRKSIFTGACIEDWHINSATNLEDVICEYVFLKEGQQDRRPSSGTFKSGEFTKLFQKVLETVDLIFSNGIDWAVFLTSYQKLQVEYDGKKLSIQAIEDKNDGVFVIRLNVPSDATQSEIEKSIKSEYEFTLKAQEECLKLQGEQLALYREEVAMKRSENTRLLGIVEIMADQESAK